MNTQRAYAPARIMRARDVSNHALRLEVVNQARDVARTVRWAVMPERSRVPSMLYRYVARRVPYIADGFTQRITRPAAIVGGGLTADCKSTAVFIGGLAAAAGCDVVLRFVRYPELPWFSHVYAVVDGRAVDPLQAYGSELSYLRAEDHPIHGT